MFGKSKEDKDHAQAVKTQEQEIKDLKEKIETLEKLKRELEQGNKMSEENIRHMIKIREEENNLELQRKTLALQQEKADEVAAVKDQYRDKLEGQLIKRSDDLKEMYAQILERLPNVNLAIKQKNGDQ